MKDKVEHVVYRLKVEQSKREYCKAKAVKRAQKLKAICSKPGEPHQYYRALTDLFQELAEALVTTRQAATYLVKAMKGAILNLAPRLHRIYDGPDSAQCLARETKEQAQDRARQLAELCFHILLHFRSFAEGHPLKDVIASTDHDIEASLDHINVEKVKDNVRKWTCLLNYRHFQDTVDGIATQMPNADTMEMVLPVEDDAFEFLNLGRLKAKTRFRIILNPVRHTIPDTRAAWDAHAAAAGLAATSGA